ncbi:MAG: ABC transporter permease [Candidatus Sericytochromatia bacterium]|nr:ABC transporter permease [Candidatus Sericytochromatia bacterium]
MEWVGRLGGGVQRAVGGWLGEIGRIGFFFLKVMQWLFIRLPDGREVISQMIKIGVESVPVVVFVCIFVGSNVALVGYSIFKEFGGQGLLGIYVGVSCIREMGPIICGAMLAAKPGTDVAATIATMRVKQQIDALEVMAVNPYWYLMVPRFIAFMFVTPALIIFADFASVSAGYCVAVFQLGVNPGNFMADLAQYTTTQDIVNGMIKGMVFAVLTFTVSCYAGFHSKPGPKGVSEAINRSVVIIASSVVLLDYFLTEIMYGVK